MNNYKRLNNKKGYTIMIILLFVVMYIYCRLIDNTFVISSFMNLQKKAMGDSGIQVLLAETIRFSPADAGK